MASSFFALFDDIATLLDDVSVMTKVATKKTAGVLGDDLALNAQQVAGVDPDRELPVVWAVAKGSLVNKAILVPAARVISAIAPARPIATPIATSFIPSLMMSRRTLLRCAPSAMRIPISLVRSTTRYDNMP